jgi:radical SAM superfamily enzyme YgiQ (UPF0313 family)
MDGRICLVSKTHGSSGAHLLLWDRISEPISGDNGPSFAFRRLAAYNSVDRIDCNCGDDAGLLLSNSLARTNAPFVSNTCDCKLRGRSSDTFGFGYEMKLGLIAMSGLRASNPELTAFGLTLPGFVERNRIVASLPSLGLLTLAALTPPAVDISYLEIPDLRLVPGVPAEFDLVAISSFSAQIKDAYELADRYRALGTKVVLGGLHVTALPEEARSHADVIVLGEGETLWPRIMCDASNDLAGLDAIYDGRSQSFDLTFSPLPRFDLLEIERYNRLTVQTQRGCPLRCEFCAASIQISPTYKLKPVDRVINEIQQIKSLWKRPYIEFADDNTFVNKTHAKSLMRAITREQVRWFTETDLSVADDDELLSLMRDAGCAQVLIGFESTNFAGLDGIEQRSNWKAKRVDQYLAAIEKIQNHGITVNGCFILGLDGTDSNSFEDIWKFVRSSGLYDVQITVQTPFPGTPLYERYMRENRILYDGAWEMCTLFDVNFQPKHMTVADLERGLRELGKKIYSEEFTKVRHSEFHRRNHRHPGLMKEVSQ